MPELFDISIWRRASQKKKQVLEQRRLQVLDDVLQAISHLSRLYNWNDLYIFGSVLKSGQFAEHSDIDIGIKGLDKLLHYRFTADFSEILDRKVDVVRLEDCSFADIIKSRGIRWKKEK